MHFIIRINLYIWTGPYLTREPHVMLHMGNKLCHLSLWLSNLISNNIIIIYFGIKFSHCAISSADCLGVVNMVCSFLEFRCREVLCTIVCLSKQNTWVVTMNL